MSFKVRVGKMKKNRLFRILGPVVLFAAFLILRIDAMSTSSTSSATAVPDNFQSDFYKAFESAISEAKHNLDVIKKILGEYR